MAQGRIAVVTGANKGIGYAIVRNLALRYPQSPFNNGPLLIYLTARDRGRGELAVQNIRQDEQLKKAKMLRADGGPVDVEFHALDIARAESIDSFADFLKKEHPEGIDFVINNAGTALQGFDADVVKETTGCNYYGTLAATRAFLPLIRPGGRIVNVTSQAGSLGRYSEPLRQRFRSATSVAQISALMEEFHDAVADGTHTEKGWPSNSYAVSKAGATGMTMIIGGEEREKGRGVLVNACCPGWVRTDMTKGRGTKTVDEGARTPIMLALEDIGGKTGLFWLDERVIEW